MNSHMKKGATVIFVPEFSLPLEYYLIPFLIIVGICLTLIVIFMITKLSRIDIKLEETDTGHGMLLRKLVLH